MTDESVAHLRRFDPESYVRIPLSSQNLEMREISIEEFGLDGAAAIRTT